MATSPPCPTWSFLRLANGKLPSTELAERSSRSSLSSRLATSRLLAATLASEEITPILEIRHWAWARTMQGLRSLLYCPVTTPNLDATSGLPIRKASFLARWGKRDSEEQGSLGGSMARHEQNEDSPLTRLELGRLRPKTLLAREPWQLVSKIRIPQLTRLGFWAGAPTTRSRGKCWIFFSNLLSYQFDQNAPTNIFHISTCWRIRELWWRESGGPPQIRSVSWILLVVAQPGLAKVRNLLVSSFLSHSGDLRIGLVCDNFSHPIPHFGMTIEIFFKLN